MAGVHSGPPHARVVAEVFGGVCDAALERDLALRRVRVDEVRLGPDDVDDDVVADVLFKLQEPRVHRQERRLRRDVVAEDAAVGGAVVELRDGAVALLSGRVLAGS